MTSNSSFIQMSSLCLAKMSSNCASKSSILSISLGASIGSIQLKFARNFVLDAASVVRSSVSKDWFLYWGVFMSVSRVSWRWKPVTVTNLGMFVCLDEATDIVSCMVLVIV